jgi:hypothetical protein
MEKEKVSDISQTIFWAIFSIGWISGIFILIFDIFAWLKQGVWPDTTIFEVTMKFGFDLYSLVYRIDWIGVKKILLWILELDLTLFAPLLGAIVGGLCSLIFAVLMDNSKSE